LVTCLRARVPELPAEFEHFGRLGGSGADERRRTEAFGEALSESLDEYLSHDLILVVDDVHKLGSASASGRLLETICRQAPDTLHLVVVSRSEPPFPTARLRGRGEVLDLDAASLAFTPREVETLVARELDDGASELERGLHRATKGWPAAVRLALEALRAASPDERPEVLEAIGRPGGTIFSYLAEEVFGRAPARLRGFIRTVAPLERFTPELCEALGLRDAEATATLFVRRGLLVRTHASEEDSYELHSLVRDFATRTWPLSDAELHHIHRAAASWFERHERLEDALRMHAQTEDERSIATFLRAYGDVCCPERPATSLNWPSACRRRTATTRSKRFSVAPILCSAI
jgi:ATP/maltotriose-dependent transcriptional regulator MalT